MAWGGVCGMGWCAWHGVVCVTWGVCVAWGGV